MDPIVSSKLQIISAHMHSQLTDEQKELASDFTKNTISFSDPGVGKTHTLIAGILLLQSYYGVSGNKINCMSFTKAAVSEIAGRYAKAAKSYAIAPTVNFNTFHSLSNAILKQAFPDIKIVASLKPAEYVPMISDLLQKAGHDNYEDKNFCKNVYRALLELNSALVFDRDHMETKFCFRKLDISYEIFTQVRVQMFIRGILMRQIPQGDIPLYCLFALLTKTDLAAVWKGKYQVMIVDEFQDLSLLDLQILNIIADTLVVIGDIKQQIYAFNGSCPEIVREYMKVRPDARTCNLTRSFRCGQKIADFATEVIKPSFPDVQTFTGHEGGIVRLMSRKDFDIQNLANQIKEVLNAQGNSKLYDIMFLYRNNASAYPIIEELYRSKIPFRCNKYTPIWEIPIFDALCAFANVAMKPFSDQFVMDAFKFLPEFKKDFNGIAGPCEVMRKTGKNIFDIQFRYKEQSTYELLALMQSANQKMYRENPASAGVILNSFLSFYLKYVNETWKLDREPEFYTALVGPICNEKLYPTLYAEELEKFNINQQCIDANTGVRCYTVHSAKGLEAKTVYLFDADDGVFPNKKKLEQKIKAGCVYEAAVDVQAERNLLYVAITRAADELNIIYNGTPTSLLKGNNDLDFVELDQVYHNHKYDYNDVDAFYQTFCKGVSRDG